MRILESKSERDQEVLQAVGHSLPSIAEFTDSEERDSFEEMLSILELHKVAYKRNERLVRGLDYYNGTCFEIKTAN